MTPAADPSCAGEGVQRGRFVSRVLGACQGGTHRRWHPHSDRESIGQHLSTAQAKHQSQLACTYRRGGQACVWVRQHAKTRLLQRCLVRLGDSPADHRTEIQRTSATGDVEHACLIFVHSRHQAQTPPLERLRRHASQERIKRGDKTAAQCACVRRRLGRVWSHFCCRRRFAVSPPFAAS